jgi:hypothetical protein
VTRLPIDANLRGWASPYVVDALRRAGFRVHVAGYALYAHRGEHRFILGCWPADEQPPAWAAELDQHHRYLLGRADPIPRVRRELERFARAWAHSRLRDALGRFIGRPEWWQAGDGLPLPGLDRPWRVA